MYTKEERADLWLDAAVPENKKKLRLISLAGSSYALAARLGSLAGKVAEAAGEECLRALQSSLSAPQKIRAMFDAYASGGIFCVTLSSDDYPEQLRQLPDPPVVLYCRGDRSLLRRRIFAAVGSRRTPPAVLKQAERFSRGLSEYFAVASGTAEGGDSAVLKGALENGAIAVLAHGHDFFVPESGKALRLSVEEKGLSVSEYPPATPARSYHYPARNRILAGLSEGVLVVSGGEKSGTRLTAECAYRYGRGVYAFPHPVGASYGAGCNALIKEYAKLTDDLVDILSDFGINLSEAEEIALPPAERAVFSALREEGEAHVGALCEKCGMAAPELSAALMLLQMKGLAAPCGGNRWTALK